MIEVGSCELLSFLCISESMVLDKTTERDEKAEGEHEEQADIDTPLIDLRVMGPKEGFGCAEPEDEMRIES